MSDDSMEEEDGIQAVVFDNGSFLTKAGFAGDDVPIVLFETAIGTKIIDNKNKSCIGEKLNKHKRDKDLVIKYPIKDGIWNDFDSLEKIWHHTFYNALNIAPEEMCVLITETPSNPKAHREKCTQILFETFNVPAQYTGNQSVLSCYASGRTTALVVDSGYTKTDLVPIYEGYALTGEHYNGPMKLKHGGHTITQYLKKLLLENNNENYNEMDIHFDDFRAMKEQFGYIALDPVKETKKPICQHPQYVISSYLRSIDYHYSDYTSIEIEKKCKKYCGNFNDFMLECDEYKLPDGNVIKLAHEKHKCTELLFNPSLIGLEYQALGKSIYVVIMACDQDIRTDLFTNIVLCGGNTMYNGLDEILYEDIKSRHNKVKISCAPNRNYSAWLGGSILSSLSTFQYMWITKEEYDSAGPGIVHRKCF